MSTLKAICALFLIGIMAVPAQADRGRGSDGDRERDKDRSEFHSGFESSDSSFDDDDDDDDEDSRSRSRSRDSRTEQNSETSFNTFEDDSSISIAEERSNTEVPIRNLNRARNVALCLAGENTRVVRNPRARCNSLVWFNVHDSVVNSAKILQNALNDTLDSGGEVQAVCKSCTATCQTVAWISGQSSYNDIDVGGGQSPSECIDQAADACGAGYSRFLFSATCKQ